MSVCTPSLQHMVPTLGLPIVFALRGIPMVILLSANCHRGDCHHRHLPLRMGCSVAEQHGPWALACGRLECTHSYAAAACSSLG